MRQTKFIMGMPIVVDAAAPAKLLAEVFGRFKQIDRQYSPFLKSSEVCRLQQHPELKPSQELAGILADCANYEKLTDGYFSVNFGSQTDPTGYVKGWAICQAAAILTANGIERYMINAGGDILATSQTMDWRIGLQHPRNRSDIMTVIAGQRLAVATSGTYERGRHIINPLTGRTAESLLSVSVIGSDIIQADVLATALFAMGLRRGLKFINQQPDYAAILVSKTGRVYFSDQLASSLQRKPLTDNLARG